MAPTADVIIGVLKLAASSAQNSWEYGTVSQAKLDWYNPELSIWSSPFPAPKLSKEQIDNTDALSYIRDGKKGGTPWLRLDGDTLIEDGSAGDPASLGIPAILIGNSDPRYFEAATRQKNHTIDQPVEEGGVPRWSNGAISHRESHPELWSDNVYMVPPFLAYYGVATEDLGLVKIAAEQCRLYGDVLKTPQGPWNHISGPLDPAQSSGVSYDVRPWSSGNGWAAAGMSRVIATMRNSPYNDQTKDEQGMLSGLIQGIISGIIELDSQPEIKERADGFLLNYLNDKDSYGEIAGTALISATVFRMAVLNPETFAQYTEWAKAKMNRVDSVIKEDGTVIPVVNPLGWWEEKPYQQASPEGQSFVVLMHAAYRDWQKATGQSEK